MGNNTFFESDANRELAQFHLKALELTIGLSAMLPKRVRKANRAVAVLKQHARDNGKKLTDRQCEAAIALMQTTTLMNAAKSLCVSEGTMRRVVRTIIDHTGLPLEGAEELRGWCLGVSDPLADLF